MESLIRLTFVLDRSAHSFLRPTLCGGANSFPRGHCFLQKNARYTSPRLSGTIDFACA